MKIKLYKELSPEFKEAANQAIEAIVNLIPFTGGTLASVIGNYRNEQKLKKIIDALEAVEKSVRINDTVVEKLLTKNQVCELMERHIQEIGLNSNEDKHEYLRNSLKNALTSEKHEYEDKELFLNLAQDLTSVEIIVLRQFYQRTDPFIETIYPQHPPETIKSSPSDLYGINIHSLVPPTFNPNILSTHGFQNLPDTTKFTKPYKYIVDNVNYVKKGLSLEKYLRENFPQKWHLIMGGCLKLDSKGLTNIKDNLDNSAVKVTKMKFVEKELHDYTTMLEMQSYPTSFGMGVDDPFARLDEKKLVTPYEGSKTELGEQFILYITE